MEKDGRDRYEQKGKGKNSIQRQGQIEVVHYGLMHH